ncbi:TetR family transcriptional regulator [Aestuariispira insulae]|uniref:TetR family transcriptional regulator n=1 Tax=Aestuariispira insulae TaxID=1461337 RepID=A0A3D9HQ61_9PROT|nr:TetR family transcriptional regulator [Aestuariispira insulae]
MEIKLPETKANTKRTSKLGRSEWIEAAFRLLTESGVTSINVEKLAKRLGVTKGSFYWHFKDRTELLEAVLDKWHDQYVIAKVEHMGGDAYTRLINLLDVVPRKRGSKHLGGSMELAMRSWARYDDDAENVVADVDRLRVNYVADLLRELGFPEEELESRAFLIYAYVMCQGIFSFEKTDDILERIHNTCTDILIPRD